MKLAPHLHRLGNDIVASYLIDLPEGITLIDAGMPGHWHDLQRALVEIGRPISDIRGVVLTHGDGDHIGFAERLRTEADVPVFIHAADAHRVRTGEKPKTPMGPSRLGPMLGFLAYGIRKNALRTRQVAEVVEVADGDVLDLPGAPVIIGMPGHSPGSVAIHVPAVDAVFVGDALTTRHVLTGREGAQPAPFTDEPDRALDSLDRLAAVPASWVLPGHGAPWHGTPADIAAAVRAA
jgi:glyoxylase-like metal-dependent hydrolase (beta-lactamase superfamily II)